MFGNQRFAVAVQVLLLTRRAAATTAGVPVTSEQLAEWVPTNPVVVRRILGPLREAGLVTSQPGPGGGWKLALPPETITLRDVYRAIACEHDGAADHVMADCPIRRCLSGVLSRCYEEAAATFERTLARVTIEDLYRRSNDVAPIEVVAIDHAVVGRVMPMGEK